jgi:hypothetical protein
MTKWGWWCGDEFIEVPKLPIQRAGFDRPPFKIVRPDGKELEIVEVESGEQSR